MITGRNHTGSDMWAVLFGYFGQILEEAKQTGLQDTTAPEHSDNAHTG